MIEWVGQRVLDAFNYMWALWGLAVQALLDLLRPSVQGRREAFRVITRQILFTGVDALPVTSAIALMLGIIIITQAGTQLPQLGAGGLVGSIIVIAVIRELGPLVTAFIVVGRSGTAIATELGNMSVGREVAALQLMGIPVGRFIVMPRMVGMVVAMICLTLYFDVVAVLGGFLIAKVKLTIPFDAFAEGIIRALSLPDVALTALKPVLFGSAISAICCHHGLSVKSSYTEVPQQTTKAMINSVTLCLILDLLITVPAYL
ncbi:MAG TPA: ABC transporter permease [Nitrospiraceae bacterium]|nr:ABC transporter permease [Nitrospiraceae bacterium]